MKPANLEAETKRAETKVRQARDFFNSDYIKTRNSIMSELRNRHPLTHH